MNTRQLLLILHIEKVHKWYMKKKNFIIQFSIGRTSKKNIME